MQHPLRTIDDILNRYTMYRCIVYGLSAYLVVAAVLAATGVVGISAIGLLATLLALVVGCYGVNKLLAGLLHVSANSESWLITALILACILPPASDWRQALLAALTGALAMASKYVLVFRGSHVVNPAAAGALVMSLTGLLPATWWIATPGMVIFSSLLALVVLRKNRAFSVFTVFAIFAVGLLLVIGMIHGEKAPHIVHDAIVSWPIIFFGSIMLTEPATQPPTRYYRLLYAAIVGSIFASQLHVGSIGSTPQMALVLGNLFVALTTPTRGMMLRLKKITQLSPAYYDLAFTLPAGRRLDFLPGQYLEWTLPHARTDERGNRRIFSIAASPTENELHIGIKRYDKGSSFKRALLAMQPGQLIRAAHVAGSFILPFEDKKPLIFVAGGIGITPFRSMAQYYIDAGKQRKATLLYLANDKRDFVYKDVFKAAEKIGLRTHYILGTATPEQLEAVLPDLKAAEIYISGPPPMVDSYRTSLHQLGANPLSIHTDHFAGY